MKKKKLIIIIFILMSILGIFGIKVDASSSKVVRSGTCGPLSYWKLFSNGTLQIYGKGEISDFSSVDNDWYYDTKILKVKISNGITSIGGDAFYACEKVKSIEIPKSVKSIRVGAFGGCKSLTSVKIPDGITVINASVFSGCKSLKKINIPNSVKSIDLYAFQECKKLESISISKNLTSINEGAFCDCSKLKNVSYKGTIAQWKKIKIAARSNGNLKKNIIRCTDGGLSYKASTVKIKSLVAVGKSLKVNWSRLSGVSGYEVEVATDSKFSRNRKKITVSKQGTTSITIKNLKAKSKYYVRIRSYKVQKVNGKTIKVYPFWSGVKNITTNK